MIPVYSIIKSQVEDSENLLDLTDESKSSLIQSILNINKSGSELIYCIIRSYENEKGSDNTIPFNGKIQKSGIRFELDALDIKLKHMLKTFIDMHERT